MVKKTIAVLTATRAEYGLLKPIILAFKEDEEFDIRVLVTGAHLSPEFGLTYREIEQDDIPIEWKTDILLSADSQSAISKSMGLAMISFGGYFADNRPDALLVLGDRYETLAVCCAAMNERIPIIHLYGGETTEGAIDEAIRHSITKMSWLHFTATESYRKRVIQLGEDPGRVYVVGAIGVENAIKTKLLTKQELEDSLGFKLGQKYAVVTFHPVTLEDDTAETQCNELLSAIDCFPEMKYIFTKANADAGGYIINSLLEAYVSRRDNCICVSSLGSQRYLSAVKYACIVIGNSSSGIIEVPSFQVPTVNIGNRQKGRIAAESVINCSPEREDIGAAIRRANDKAFRVRIKMQVNPYGDGNASEKIRTVLKEKLMGSPDLEKKFYDISFNEDRR